MTWFSLGFNTIYLHDSEGLIEMKINFWWAFKSCFLKFLIEIRFITLYLCLPIKLFLFQLLWQLALYEILIKQFSNQISIFKHILLSTDSYIGLFSIAPHKGIALPTVIVVGLSCSIALFKNYQKIFQSNKPLYIYSSENR